MSYVQGRSGVLNGFTLVGGRAVAVTLRPLSGVLGAAAGAGRGLERRAVERILDNGDIERLLASDHVQALVEQALESDGAKRLIDTFFDSGVFDRLVERLLTSDALWYLVDEIAASPAVTAAISQQGLGFADQVGEEVRTRSRSADDWLERAARRLIHRHPKSPPATPDAAPS
ncbi:MAG: hypothetical protein JO179_02045 [Solirubrobacterales bacterium]|nr:hypothetical protein [Solirubrobacterales bacterium]